VVKPVGSGTCYAGYHLGGLLARVARHPAAPRVLLLDDDLSAAEMAGLYRACDLLVHPYRGEGFGMPVLEARACGLPVLVTRGGATDDFAGGPGTVGIAAPRRPVDLPGAHLGRPWVLEPDPASLGAALDGALAGLAELRREAVAEAAAVRARFGWAQAAQRLERLAFESRCSERGAARRELPFTR
jgi:glycosyltransferase involved in cell wall biosynthesis